MPPLTEDPEASADRSPGLAGAVQGGDQRVGPGGELVRVQAAREVEAVGAVLARLAECARERISEGSCYCCCAP